MRKKKWTSLVLNIYIYIYVIGVEHPLQIAVQSVLTVSIWSTLFNRRRLSLWAKDRLINMRQVMELLSSSPDCRSNLSCLRTNQRKASPYLQALLFTLQQIETCVLKSCTTGSSKSHLRLQDDPTDIMPIKGFYLCKHSCTGACTNPQWLHLFI